MITLSRLLGAITLVALVLGMIAVCPGVTLGTFVDFPSVAFVVFATGCLLLVGAHREDWANACRLAMGAARSADDVSRRSACRFLTLGSRAAISTGTVAYLVQLAAMLGKMDDPAAIGPGVAVAMLPLLYGIVLSEFVFAPLLSWATSVPGSEDDVQRDPGKVLLPLLVVALTLVPTFLGLLTA
ncbi:MAG TPA: hypothetical protein VMY37_30670 [Thermoguttaceae bacterium]|nr:hypothetical protein [Thermoguttaceae bacterium]